MASAGVNGGSASGNFEGGAFITSPDGINWIEQLQVEKSSFVWEVAYAEGRWLGATSGYGGMFYSDNGTDWKFRTDQHQDSVPRFQTSAAHHDGMWIAGLRDGAILQSVDGQRWASRVIDTASVPDWLNAVHYSSQLGKWFVGGDNGALFSSPDGVSWTEENYGGSGIEAMAEGNGRIIGAGRGWHMYSSTDGSSWNRITHPVSGSGRFDAIQFGDGKWVAVGERGNIAYSSDGNSWSKVAVSGREDLHAVHYASGLWVVTGLAAGPKPTIYWSANLTTWTKANVSGELATPQGHGLQNVGFIDGTWIASGYRRWADPQIYTSADGKNWMPFPAITYPGGGIQSIVNVDGNWWAFGHTLRDSAFVMTTSDVGAPSADRSLLFSDSASYTVQDTNEPEAFTRLPLPETLGGRGETLYVSFKLKRANAFGQFRDFTGLQLSRSATNLPRPEDLGFGNSGPVDYYGIFVEGPLPSISPDVQVPLDLEEHTIIARIDYEKGTVAMITDPQSATEIELATRHPAPTHPFSTIMLRAGHADTSYIYSRIAVGQSAEKVLGFSLGQDSIPPANSGPPLQIVRAENGADELVVSWPKTEDRYILESSRDLTRFSEIPSIREENGRFRHRIIQPRQATYYRLRQRP